MKKNFKLYITLLRFFNTFISCASWYWPNVNQYEHVYTGMVIKEFVSIHPKSINEYMYGLDETQEESEALEFWVQEDGGANLLAKSVGLVDTHYTF